MSDLITNVSKYKKGWTGGLPETPCGAGSRLKDTALQRQWIPKIISKYNIKTVADIGAGDLNWFNKMSIPPGVEVTHYDLVPRHPLVNQFDIIQEIPEKSDLIMCLWVLNHFPYDHCRAALKNIINSGSRYLLMTDRASYHKDQPPEIDMPYLENIRLSVAKDCSMRLIDLGAPR